MAGLLVVGFLCNQAVRPLATAREALPRPAVPAPALLVESKS